MSRRGAGEGSVHRSPDGSGWVAMLEMPRGADGKRRRRKRRAQTRAEAQRILRQMREELQTTGEITSPTRTVAQAVESYLDLRRGEGQSAGARDDDKWLTGLVLDGLGSRRISELTVAQADDFLANAPRASTAAARSAPSAWPESAAA